MVAQLESIQVFAAGAPVILAGTRKGEVEGGAAALKRLSADLLRELEKQCAPAVAGLERDKASGLCFFGVENSRGYAGDATIQELMLTSLLAIFLQHGWQNKQVDSRQWAHFRVSWIRAVLWHVLWGVWGEGRARRHLWP